jgi:hypothetical protein
MFGYSLAGTLVWICLESLPHTRLGSAAADMPKRNLMARALRTPPYRTRSTKTKAEKIRKLETRHRGVGVIDERMN